MVEPHVRKEENLAGSHFDVNRRGLAEKRVALIVRVRGVRRHPHLVHARDRREASVRGK